MKIILQRVSQASVVVDGQTIGHINQGYVVFLGIGASDTKEDITRLIAKIKNIRIFADKDGKTNLSINDVQGEVLIISQFTLYADCKKGNRPSFTEAAPPKLAEELYNCFVEESKPHFKKVAQGKFAANMQVTLTNDGPFTITLT